MSETWNLDKVSRLAVLTKRDALQTSIGVQFMGSKPWYLPRASTWCTFKLAVCTLLSIATALLKGCNGFVSSVCLADGESRSKNWVVGCDCAPIYTHRAHAHATRTGPVSSTGPPHKNNLTRTFHLSFDTHTDPKAEGGVGQPGYTDPFSSCSSPFTTLTRHHHDIHHNFTILPTIHIKSVSAAFLLLRLSIISVEGHLPASHCLLRMKPHG
ncbi:hypothetical protein DFH27DRAFT_599406 [Peziza echinospora]|nr:hypothetical protein DFH27DRAFT_599406 [Peziza echinospora]